MKKHILDFKENECIHVASEKEAEQLMLRLRYLGVRWVSGSTIDPHENYWSQDEENKTYYPKTKSEWGGMTHGTLYYAESEEHTVYKLDEVDFSHVQPKTLIRPLEALVEFQTAFKCPVNDIPTLLDKDRAKLRYDLGKEELDEYMEAVEAGDIVGISDSIGDQLFVLMGTVVEHGLQHILMDIFEEIFRSNMSKLDENGQPIINGENGVYDESRPKGKVLKSPDYYPPNLKQFLNNDSI